MLSEGSLHEAFLTPQTGTSGAAGAASSGRPIVATSLNPFSKVAEQTHCFSTWAELGFEPLTFNDARESDRLADHGIRNAARVVLPASDTGARLFGKPMPKIVSVLKHLAEMAPGRPVLLVNSDLFPAMRSTAAVDFWLGQAPAMALTREDCDLVEAHDPADLTPYRSGLDAFLIAPATLPKINAMLARLPVAERMCFGIPGWDFLMGALIRSDAIGGRVMDSGVLLHERHAQTYANVDEFVHYTPAMRELGADATGSAERIAYEFSETIAADCRTAEANAELVRLIYYRRPSAPPASEAAYGVVAALSEVAPFVLWNTSALALTRLAERQIRRGADLERTRLVLGGRAGAAHGFAEELAAILFHLLVEDAAGRGQAARPGRVGALERRTAAEAERPFGRRLRVARLFGDALVRRGLFDAALHDFIALACENDAERRLLAALRAMLPSALFAQPQGEPR